MSEHRCSGGRRAISPHARRAPFVVAALTAMALLVGCSSSSSGGTSASVSGTAASASSGATAAAGGAQATIQSAVTSLLKPAQPVQISAPAITGLPTLKGKTVLLVPALGIVFATAIKQVQAALAKVGVATQVCDGQGNPSTIATCLSQAPSVKNIVGVMTIGVPYQSAPSAFQAVTAKHIPVLVAQQNPDGQASSSKLAFVGTTELFNAATKAADEYVIAKSGGKANVLSLGFNESADVRNATKTMTNYLKSACPGCTVSTKSVPSNQISEASSLISAAILQNSHLDWLVSLNSDVSNASVVKGLQSANATTKVKQGGVGNGVASLQAVKSGQSAYTALISGELLAYNWTDGLLRLIAGDPVPATYPVVVRLIDKSNIGSLNLSPDSALSFTWFGGQDTFTRAYAKLWGAS